ncbi:MAG: ribosomal protein S18-alanine N-acetyltransferase [Thiotrichaceae bacterium]
MTQLAQSRFQLMPMTLMDIPEVMAIESIVQEQPWTEGIFKDCLRVGYLCWACKENSPQGHAQNSSQSNINNKKLIGYLIQSIAVDEMHILNVCIHPDKQRMNLGTQLVQHAERIALKKNKKTHTSILEVRPSNIAAIRLYQKLGYQQIGLRKNYYPAKEGVREDGIVMSKQLDGVILKNSRDQAL